jgi:hypothetical protein
VTWWTFPVAVPLRFDDLPDESKLAPGVSQNLPGAKKQPFDPSKPFEVVPDWAQDAPSKPGDPRPIIPPQVSGRPVTDPALHFP